MGALILGLAMPLVVANAYVAVDPIARWRADIIEASTRFGIPEAWIERVMRAESGGRTTLGGRYIRSPKGAMGLMQLMPGTWSEVRAQLGLGTDPDDPRDNILAGTFYLRLMYDRFGYPGLFGAYNAGPARYAAWLAGRAPLPGETIAYLAKVGVPSATGALAVAVGAPDGENAAPASARPSMFVALRRREAPGIPPQTNTPNLVLFAIRKDGR